MIQSYFHKEYISYTSVLCSPCKIFVMFSILIYALSVPLQCYTQPRVLLDLNDTTWNWITHILTKCIIIPWFWFYSLPPGVRNCFCFCIVSTHVWCVKYTGDWTESICNNGSGFDKFLDDVLTLWEKISNSNGLHNKVPGKISLVCGNGSCPIYWILGDVI